MTAQAKNGMQAAWSLVSTMKFDYINKQGYWKAFVEKRWGREASAATLAPGGGYQDCGPTGTIVCIK